MLGPFYIFRVKYYVVFSGAKGVFHPQNIVSKKHAICKAIASKVMSFVALSCYFTQADKLVSK